MMDSSVNRDLGVSVAARLVVLLFFALVSTTSASAHGQTVEPPVVYTCESTCNNIRDFEYRNAHTRYLNSIFNASDDHIVALAQAQADLYAIINGGGCGIFCINQAIVAYNNAVAQADLARDIAYQNATERLQFDRDAADAMYDDCMYFCSLV